MRTIKLMVAKKGFQMEWQILLLMAIPIVILNRSLSHYTHKTALIALKRYSVNQVQHEGKTQVLSIQTLSSLWLLHMLLKCNGDFADHIFINFPLCFFQLHFTYKSMKLLLVKVQKTKRK
ncbi:hypothetical protein Ccrd_006507 [Cynara cardunculus var. scolymus]|uniref:Uncharacterized protein n=1 Tax=Cynara cardunculus var. scolymus TaxID=59895 RepID=A0A103XIN7_CYNCS|nr:hypothetical protein Ccrd_006507 [Cynara cardunculus var. scolymus]